MGYLVPIRFEKAISYQEEFLALGAREALDRLWNEKLIAAEERIWYEAK
jgi:hypothetical protein